MAPTIVPPYLLARIATAGAHRWERAAQAARATLAAPLPYNPPRRALRLSVQAPGTLVAETVPAPDRTIWDAQNRESLPGVRVRGEDDPPSGDTAVNEAFDGLGATHAFLWDAFTRDGLDGRGGALHATVHYGRGYDNAFWDGERMVFGDGDGELFTGFTGSLTIIAHELAHGVIDRSGGLQYRGQSGALNESIADVFGALAEQHARDETVDRATWLIGAGVFTDEVHGEALRSLAAPGTAYDDDLLGRDPQPDNMRDFVVTDEDNGGVHINSGIPNHAFYRVAARLGGRAWERAGRIWYLALLDAAVIDTTDFAAFARATISVAASEYGDESEEVSAVVAGWSAVGVIDERTK